MTIPSGRLASSPCGSMTITFARGLTADGHIQSLQGPQWTALAQCHAARPLISLLRDDLGYDGTFLVLNPALLTDRATRQKTKQGFQNDATFLRL